MKNNSFEEINDMLGDIIGGTSSQNPFSFSLESAGKDDGTTLCSEKCTDNCSGDSYGTVTGTVTGSRLPGLDKLKK
ncbi:hypothetical protein [Bacteroides sp.]